LGGEIIIKTRKVSFRISESDYSKIQKKAQKANLNISRYVSLSALDKDIIFLDDIKEMNFELLKIGNNLNQLTMLAHQGRIKEVNLTKTSEEISKIWEELCKLLKKKG